MPGICLQYRLLKNSCLQFATCLFWQDTGKNLRPFLPLQRKNADQIPNCNTTPYNAGKLLIQASVAALLVHPALIGLPHHLPV